MFDHWPRRTTACQSVLKVTSPCDSDGQPTSAHVTQTWRDGVISLIFRKQQSLRGRSFVRTHLTSLDEDVFSSAHEICGVKCWFKLSGDESALSCEFMTIFNPVYWIILKVNERLSNQTGWMDMCFWVDWSAVRLVINICQTHPVNFGQWSTDAEKSQTPVHSIGWTSESGQQSQN